jgi:hypothetical protein
MRLECSRAGREACLPDVRAQVIGSAAMRSGVARPAQRDQVFLGVGSRMAAKFPVVHFKIRHHATGLTPPAVAAQYLLAQSFVRQGIKTQAAGFGADHSDDVFSRKCSSLVQLGCTIKALPALSQRPKGNRRTRIRFSSTTIMLPSLRVGIPVKVNAIPVASRTVFRSESEQQPERSDADLVIVEQVFGIVKRDCPKRSRGRTILE